MFHKKPAPKKHTAPLTVPANTTAEVKVRLDPPVAVPPKIVKPDPKALELLNRVHAELGGFLKGGSAGTTAQHLAEDIKAYLDGLNRV